VTWMTGIRRRLRHLSDWANSLFPSVRLPGLLILSAAVLMLTPVCRPCLYLSVALNLALVALALADYRLLKAVDQCEAWRERDDVFSVGARNPVTLSVRNRSALSLHLEVGDEHPHEFTADGESPRFRLDPDGTWQHTYYLVPHRRGDYRFGRLTLRARTPLGLLQRQRAFDLPQPVAVYPNLQDVRKYNLLGRRNRLEQMGLRRLRVRGRSLEFESLRDYVPGDELRHVHWKASARKGKLVTKQYDLERSQHLVIALDLGRTMASRLGDLTKLDHAVNASLLLAHVASFCEDYVGLVAFADEVVGYLPPHKGRHQTGRVARFLYPLEPRLAEADYRGAFLYLGQQCRRRCLIVVLTDLLDPESSAQLLHVLSPLTRRHVVLCVAFGDYELAELVSRAPRQQRELYEHAVALTLRQDRARALAILRSRGVLTLDAAPSDLSIAVVNRYLALKEEALI